MTKKEPSFDHVTPQLLERVKAVLTDHRNHRYSTSQVYGVYNSVMQTSEAAQTCSTCLRDKARELERWLAKYEGAAPTMANAAMNIMTADEAAAVLKSYADEAGITDTSSADDRLIVLRHFLEVHGNDLTPEHLEDLQRTIAQGEGAAAAEADARIKEVNLAPNYDDPTHPNHVAPEANVTRYPMTDGLPFDVIALTDEDTNALPFKGTVLRADGSKVKPGIYRSSIASPTEIAVQVGGKCTVRAAAPLEDDVN